MMLPDLRDIAPLGEPFEILELRDGQTITLEPTGWEIGRAEIHPRDGRPAKEIRILRLYVRSADKPTLPQYWDVTAQHLIAGLLGYLEKAAYKRQRFTIKKHGEAPTARFTLEVESRA